MEQTIVNKEPSTGILLSPNEAEEYRKYKRAKLILAVNEQVSKGCVEVDETTGLNLVRAAELARKYSLAALRVTPNLTKAAVTALEGSNVKTDVLIGGTGRTLAKVKTYECKLALRMGAEEFTVIPDPNAVSLERFFELKKELKKIKRKARSARVKLYTEEKDFQRLCRLMKMLQELGVGLSFPWFLGAQRLKTEVKTTCFLEVRGVRNTEDFKKMAGAGMDRILSSDLETIRKELVKEAENASFAVPTKTFSQISKIPEKEEELQVEKAENYRSLLKNDQKEEE